jgi:hypothetical protein
MSGKLYNQNEKYIRPKNTITDTIQNQEDIEDLLKDYEEVSFEEISFIPLNTSIRYLIYDKIKKKELFRFGGILKLIHDKYLVLSGKDNKTFSVQRYILNSKGQVIYNTRIFQKIDKMKNYQHELHNTLEKSNQIMNEQYYLIQKQKEDLDVVKKKVKQLEKKILN